MFHISKLQSEEIRWRYDIKLRNRFEALGDRGFGGRTIMILSTYSKPWIDRKQTVGKNQGKERGETENGGYKIEMTETEMEREI